MAKFPTIEEMAQNVAEKALDEYEYKGKTLREWVEIISAIPVTAIPATGINVATKVGTNLAEVGTDATDINVGELISRQAAIDAIGEKSDEIYKTKQKGATYPHDDFFQGMAYAEDVVKQLPSAVPKRIRGQWITDKQGFVTWSAICNKCGARTQMFDGYYNFCPNCGAKMEVTT